jgi:hypothetical protein
MRVKICESEATAAAPAACCVPAPAGRGPIGLFSNATTRKAGETTTATRETGKLIKLRDAGETVAVGDVEIRGLSVRDEDAGKSMTF